MENKAIYQSNFKILYHDLIEAIDDYLAGGHIMGEFQYINAYLSAVIHAAADYFERYPVAKQSELVLAVKKAANALKHKAELAHSFSVVGGFSFPISLSLEFLPIEVVWAKDIPPVRHPDQNKAYDKLLAGRPILESLKQIAVYICENENAI